MIETSRDSNAPSLFGERTGVVMVDAMRDAEAVSLLLGSTADVCRSDEVQTLAESIVDAIDHIALAVDLAAAKIATDVEDGHNVVLSLRRYLDALNRHRDDLLGNQEYSQCSIRRAKRSSRWSFSIIQSSSSLLLRTRATSTRSRGETYRQIIQIDGWALL